MPDYPHVIFDLRHRSVEILMGPGPAVGTVEFDDAHLVDIDADDHAVSIEILSLDDLQLDEMADEFGFYDQVPAIRLALDRAKNLPTRSTAVTYGDIKTIRGSTRTGRVLPQVNTDDSSEAPEIHPVIG
jgi:hypothetical protein